jgi:hypothetical protein
VARSKSTSRSEARRRHRAAQAAARAAAAEKESAALETTDAAPDPEPEPETPRRMPFRFPNIREDLLSLPGMFRDRPLLFAPIGLMFVAFLLALVPLPDDATIRFVVQFYVSSFLYPAIIAMFLGGLLAPRASYLVGLLIGLINGALLVALFAIGPRTAAATPPGELASGVLQLFLIPALYGIAIGAFAAWYRDFLRRSGERRRASMEARARDRKRDQRRGSRPAR